MMNEHGRVLAAGNADDAKGGIERDHGAREDNDNMLCNYFSCIG